MAKAVRNWPKVERKAEPAAPCRKSGSGLSVGSDRWTTTEAKSARAPMIQKV